MPLRIAADRFATATIKLGANLEVNSETLPVIGTAADQAFAGTFDGNGYTISNANFSSTNSVAGLFGYLASSAVVENIMFTGTSAVTTPNGKCTALP